MNAKTLLLELSRRGATASLEDGRVWIEPAAALDNELRDRIIELKPELLLLLSGAASGESTPAPDAPTAAPADDRAERTARIRALAATVTPAQLLKARKTIAPALTRDCTSEEIHEFILLRCWLDQGIGATGQPAKGK